MKVKQWIKNNTTTMNRSYFDHLLQISIWKVELRPFRFHIFNKMPSKEQFVTIQAPIFHSLTLTFLFLVNIIITFLWLQWTDSILFSHWITQTILFNWTKIVQGVSHSNDPTICINTICVNPAVGTVIMDAYGETDRRIWIYAQICQTYSAYH